MLEEASESVRSKLFSHKKFCQQKISYKKNFLQKKFLTTKNFLQQKFFPMKNCSNKIFFQQKNFLPQNAHLFHTMVMRCSAKQKGE